MAVIESFPHIAIFVRDLERARRFYIEGLGFEQMVAGRAEGMSQLLGIPNAVALTQFMRHSGGINLELWTLESGAAEGDANGLPSNLRGRPHLCFVVDDLDGMAARIEEFGGTALRGSRTTLYYGTAMFCADPDGVRIELIQMTGQWRGYES